MKRANNEVFQKPLNYGWKRDLLITKPQNSSAKKTVVSYISPEGVRVGNHYGVRKILSYKSSSGVDLSMKNFTFAPVPVTDHPNEREIDLSESDAPESLDTSNPKTRIIRVPSVRRSTGATEPTLILSDDDDDDDVAVNSSRRRSGNLLIKRSTLRSENVAQEAAKKRPENVVQGNSATRSVNVSFVRAVPARRSESFVQEAAKRSLNNIVTVKSARRSDTGAHVASTLTQNRKRSLVNIGSIGPPKKKTVLVTNPDVPQSVMKQVTNSQISINKNVSASSILFEQRLKHRNETLGIGKNNSTREITNISNSTSVVNATHLSSLQLNLINQNLRQKVAASGSVSSSRGFWRVRPSTYHRNDSNRLHTVAIKQLISECKRSSETTPKYMEVIVNGHLKNMPSQFPKPCSKLCNQEFSEDECPLMQCITCGLQYHYKCATDWKQKLSDSNRTILSSRKWGYVRRKRCSVCATQEAEELIKDEVAILEKNEKDEKNLGAEVSMTFENPIPLLLRKDLPSANHWIVASLRRFPPDMVGCGSFTLNSNLAAEFKTYQINLPYSPVFDAILQPQRFVYLIRGYQVYKLSSQSFSLQNNIITFNLKGKLTFSPDRQKVIIFGNSFENFATIPTAPTPSDSFNFLQIPTIDVDDDDTKVEPELTDPSRSEQSPICIPIDEDELHGNNESVEKTISLEADESKSKMNNSFDPSFQFIEPKDNVSTVDSVEMKELAYRTAGSSDTSTPRSITTQEYNKAKDPETFVYNDVMTEYSDTTEMDLNRESIFFGNTSEADNAIRIDSPEIAVPVEYIDDSEAVHDIECIDSPQVMDNGQADELIECDDSPQLVIDSESAGTDSEMVSDDIELSSNRNGPTNSKESGVTDDLSLCSPTETFDYVMSDGMDVESVGMAEDTGTTIEIEDNNNKDSENDEQLTVVCDLVEDNCVELPSLTEDQELESGKDQSEILDVSDEKTPVNSIIIEEDSPNEKTNAQMSKRNSLLKKKSRCRLPINKLLNHEVFDNIFSFLDTFSVLQSRIVCREWKRIIDSSPQLCGGAFRPREGYRLTLSNVPALFRWLLRREVVKVDLRAVSVSSHSLVDHLLRMCELESNLKPEDFVLKEIMVKSCSQDLVERLKHVMPNLQLVPEEVIPTE